MTYVSVLPGDWGDASEGDIRAVAVDVTKHLERRLRRPVASRIRVESLPADQQPITFYREGGVGPHRVGLPVRGRYWAQVAYQFAHEYCHVLSRYERLQGNPNNWFHEALCELASVYALRHMGRSWVIEPPYPHWTEYAPKLRAYVGALEERLTAPTPPPDQFATWLDSNENAMRRNAEIREKNGVVAMRLLAAFVEQPEGWNAVRQMPVGHDPIREYLRLWREGAEDEDRPFIKRLEHELFGAASKAKARRPRPTRLRGGG